MTITHANMSDEDRDVDIESDAEKRAHHNALERKRRDHIKDSFSGLRDSIPSLQGEKVKKNASRAQILKKAADYIQFMRRKNSSHQQDIDDLKRQNLMLENQTKDLQTQQSSMNKMKPRSRIKYSQAFTPDTSSSSSNDLPTSSSAKDLQKQQSSMNKMKPRSRIKYSQAFTPDTSSSSSNDQPTSSSVRSLEKAKTMDTFTPAGVMDTASLITNPKGDVVSAFDGGSGSESSDSESSSQSRRKKMKTGSPTTSSSGT